MRTTTRPRGFIDNYSPRPQTLTLITQVQGILRTYQAHLPLTIRQIFYRLVTQHQFDKTEKAYKNVLVEVLNKARRAGLIPFDVIRDDGDVETTPPGWSSQDSFVDSVRHWADRYTLHPDIGQEYGIIIVCEATGMVPQLERVAGPFGAIVMSAGGFNSTTGKHNIARKIAEGFRPTRILHIGDYDPSGVHIASSLDEDLAAFLTGLDGDGEMVFERIAVTPKQVAQYRLPTAPPKATDNRSFTGLTTQAEALDPADLANIVEASIRETWDDAVHTELVAREEEERALLQEWLSRKVI